MHSLILSHWREHRMGVVWQDFRSFNDSTSKRPITHPPKSQFSADLQLLLLFSLLDKHAPISPNPTLGSLLPYMPSDPLSATLRTSGNAPTLLSTGPLSSPCVTSTTTSFSRPNNTSTLTL